MSNRSQEFNYEDIEYLQYGDRSMMLRLCRPASAGPFPLIVDLHGGAWNEGGMAGCQVRDEVLACAGFATAALDFRHGPDGYPTSLQDIHYAIRWLKMNAERYNLDSERVGLSGQSSGGHLAALIAMRPDDDRYSALALNEASGIDAKVCCAALVWPVINPLSRYRHAHRSLETPESAGWVGRLPEFHDIYWPDEDAMAEGNPMMALVRGETVTTPPALWLQGTPDIVHDYHDPESGQPLKEPERFCELYRSAGGDIDLIRVDYETRELAPAMANLVPFFQRHLG